MALRGSLRRQGEAEFASSDLRGALPPSTPQHHASVTDPEGVAALLHAIDGYRGSNVTPYALQLSPLVPLSRQAVAIVRAAAIDRQRALCLAGARNRSEPLFALPTKMLSIYRNGAG